MSGRDTSTLLDFVEAPFDEIARKQTRAEADRVFVISLRPAHQRRVSSAASIAVHSKSLGS
jgi:hypothetical protein